MPRCSVIIPVYNSLDTIDACIVSARKQDEEDIEIIIIDDASTDSTINCIQKHLLLDNRIILIKNETNMGKAFSMNKALTIASGNWIAVLDADDIYFPGRLSKLIDIGEKYKVNIVADNQITYDRFQEKDDGLLFKIDAKYIKLDLCSYVNSITERKDFGPLKPVVRQSFLNEVGIKYNENARFSQDFYFLLELFLTGVDAIIVGDAQYRYTLPFSKTERRWTLTGAGAWRHDFAIALRINESYLADARIKCNPHVFKMLSKKSVILEKNLKWNILKTKALDGCTFEVMSYVISNPSIFKVIVKELSVATLERNLSMVRVFVTDYQY